MGVHDLSVGVQGLPKVCHVILELPPGCVVTEPKDIQLGLRGADPVLMAGIATRS